MENRTPLGLEKGVAVQQGAGPAVVIGGDCDNGLSRQPVHDVDGTHVDLMVAKEPGHAGQCAGAVGAGER